MNKHEKDLENLTKIVMSGILKMAIRNGEINIDGKSDSEIKEEFYKNLDKGLKGKVDFKLVLDHTQDILRQAKVFYKERNLNFSCIFYATWLEHWINDLIVTQGLRKKLSDKHLKDILQRLNSDSKLSWLISLLDLPEINRKHLKTIRAVFDFRNQFIHYKWKSKDPNDDSDKERLKKVLQEAERTVRYLKRYFTNNITKLSDKKIKKIIIT